MPFLHPFDSFADAFLQPEMPVANRRANHIVDLMHAAEIPDFDRLTDQERLALADDILGSLKSPESLPAPLAHRAELDRRWAAFEANPSRALTKEQFRARVAELRK